MHKQLKKIFHNSKEVRLSAKEKEDIRNAVVRFMWERPIKTRKGYTAFTMPRFRFARLASASLAILMVASSSAAYGAEQSLPGDALYPVKVHVNEEVRGALLPSEEARAQWDIRRSERRLEEAAELASRDQLSEELHLELESRFEKHAQKVSERIERMEQKERVHAAARIASNFQGSLQAHLMVLDKLEQRKADRVVIPTVSPTLTTTSSTASSTPSSTPDPTSSPTPSSTDTPSAGPTTHTPDEEEANNAPRGLRVSQQVRDQIENVQKMRENLEHKIGGSAMTESRDAAENRQQTATMMIERVERILEERPHIPANDAQEQLDKAVGLLHEGESYIEEGEYTSAFRSFQASHRTAQEAHYLLQAQKRFNLDLNEHKNKQKQGGDERNNDDKDKEIEQSSSDKPSEKNQHDKRVEEDGETEGEDSQE